MPVTYVLADNIVKRSTTNDLSMLFDRDKGVMYELNESASAVVDLLHRGVTTVTDLVSALAEQFDASAEEITEDVRGMLADFADAGLVVAHEVV